MIVTRKKYDALQKKHNTTVKELANLFYELEIIYGDNTHLVQKYRDKLQKEGIEINRKKLSIGDKLFTIIFIFIIFNPLW